jgi:hypothetical protein
MERILYRLSCALCEPLLGRRYKNLKPRRSLRKAAEFTKKGPRQLATTFLFSSEKSVNHRGHWGSQRFFG